MELPIGLWGPHFRDTIILVIVRYAHETIEGLTLNQKYTSSESELLI